MKYVQESLNLTHEAVLKMLSVGVEKASAMGQSQCIVIVDASGVVLGQIRMTGAKYLSLKSAMTKARTSASIGVPSDAIPEAVGPAIALATQGEVTRLGGGLPIYLQGHLVGGIGVGSGSPSQDSEVGAAAITAIGGTTG